MFSDESPFIKKLVEDDITPALSFHSNNTDVKVLSIAGFLIAELCPQSHTDVHGTRYIVPVHGTWYQYAVHGNSIW